MGLCVKVAVNESVIIKTAEGDVEVKVIAGNQTKLNITAPESIKIWRKELLDENNNLLEKHKSTDSDGHTGSPLQVRRNQSSHSRVGPKEDPPKTIQGGMAEIEKMSKCTSARLKKEEGHDYVTLWCYKKNEACTGVCDDWDDKRTCAHHG